MNCPHCESQAVVKNGRTQRHDGSVFQNYLCRTCTKQFNDRTGTPMSRLRTPSVIVGAALNVRSEGLGVRAAGRAFEKSHSTVIRWEQRLAQQSDQWSPPAPPDADVTLEGDEVYTRVRENLSPRSV